MACIDHGRALVAKPLDARENGVAALRIDRHGGLVEKDELGLVRNAARDVEAAQQASGELLGAEPRELGEANEVDGLINQRAAARAVRYVQRAEEIDVLADRQLLEHRHLLGHDADPPLEVIARRRHILAEQADRAPIVCEQLEHAVDGRGLAAAVGPQQSEYLSLGDMEIEVVECEQLAIALDQSVHRDDIHGCLPSGPRSGTTPNPPASASRANGRRAADHFGNHAASSVLEHRVERQ